MSRGFHVLLVEDDDPLRGCLDEFLAAQGLRVRSTALGQEAMQWARSTRFDFSILDLHLPGMTGLEVLEALRRRHRMPSIIISGAASHDEADRARAQGVFTFLRKPLDLAELRTTVDDLIRCHFGDRRSP